MAKKADKDLFERMRSLGLRKSRARAVTDALRKNPKKAPGAARKTASDLTAAVTEIQDRIKGGPSKRKAAAKKAARTRKLKAKARSDAAKKGARKRAKAKS